MTMTAKKILIVEDSPTQATRAQLTLQKAGYIVHVSNNGAEGLKTAIQMVPDLVITDIRMPNMDGYQLCAKFRSFSKTRNIPVIMLTVKGEVMDIIKGLESGADSFITKPYDPKELLECIGDRLENMENESSFGKGKTIATSKHQILEILLSTYGTISNCDVMGLLIFKRVYKLGDKDILILMSLSPLSEEVVSQFTGKLLADAHEKTGRKIETDSLEKTLIIKESDASEIVEPFSLAINIPISISERPIGMLCATSSAKLLKEDVKLLYTLAIKAANTFDRMRQW